MTRLYLDLTRQVNVLREIRKEAFQKHILTGLAELYFFCQIFFFFTLIIYEINVILTALLFVSLKAQQASSH